MVAISVSLLAILLARDADATANAPLTWDFKAAVLDNANDEVELLATTLLLNANELVDAFATTPLAKA